MDRPVRFVLSALSGQLLHHKYHVRCLYFGAAIELIIHGFARKLVRITVMRESPVKTSAVSVLAMMALVCILAIPLNTRAQATSTAVIPDVYIARAVVISIVSNQLSETPGSTQNYNEVVTARILTGVERNKTIEFQASGIVGDGQNLLRGDIVYVTRTTDTDNDPMAAVYTYGAIDHYRLPALVFFAILFLSCIVFIGGKQGLRGLISLAGGMFLIFFILLPGALHGYSPILLSIVIASLIASIGAYITHGVSQNDEFGGGRDGAHHTSCNDARRFGCPRYLFKRGHR